MNTVIQTLLGHRTDGYPLVDMFADNLLDIPNVDIDGWDDYVRFFYTACGVATSLVIKRLLVTDTQDFRYRIEIGIPYLITPTDVNSRLMFDVEVSVEGHQTFMDAFRALMNEDGVVVEIDEGALDDFGVLLMKKQVSTKESVNHVRLYTPESWNDPFN